MKRLLSLTALAFSIMLFASFKNTASAQVRAGISINYQTFYDELDPYGRWVDYPEYGYVWIPDAGPDFRPYSTNGHWVWSDEYDWMWVSDYDWGWAPFHYGRWMEDPYYGWIWVPGYEWSPAWVAWRDGGDYYGWAPLRPGINISIGFNLGGYNCPDDYWSFAPRRYITSPRIWDYCVPRRNNVTIIHQTTIINNYNYNRNVFRTGPGRRDAERYAGRINSVRFRDARDPGRARSRGNEVSVYRPNVQRDNNRSFQPRRVQQYDRNGRGDIGRANGNNPQRQGSINNRGFDRNSPNNNDDRRFRSNDNGNGISGRRNNVITRDRAEPLDNGNNNGNARPERPNRQFEPRNNNNEVGETSPFRGGRNRDNGSNPGNGNGNRDRNMTPRNDNPVTNNPIERRNAETQPGERRMQRREVFDRGNSGRQMDQPRQMEQPRQEQPRRMEQPQNRQFEQRRVEQPQQPRQQEQRSFEPRGGGQPQGGGGRQFERRSDNNGGGGGGNNGGGHGRRGR